MKPYCNQHHLSGFVLLASVMAVVPTASADVSYTSSATLLYTINSITNLDNPNDLSGLSMSGSFLELTGANDFYAAISGDGSYQTNIPNFSGALSPSGTFSVNGHSALYGSVNTLHTGVFSMDFSNTGTNSYTVDVKLDYWLNAVTNGIYANSAIFLDFWDTNNNVSGVDYAAAGTYLDHAYDSQSVSGFADLVFTLAPGASNRFIAKVGSQSGLDSISTAPVPMPSAFWLFAAGLLGMISVKKMGSIDGRVL